MNDAVALLRDLVAIDSTNPDLGPGAGEAALAAAVADWLGAFNLEVSVEQIELGRPNVTAIVRGTGGGRSVMLNAHLDTVGVSGYANPFAALIDGDRCFGRGALDTKAGLVAAMRATAAATLFPNAPISPCSLPPSRSTCSRPSSAGSSLRAMRSPIGQPLEIWE